jgi:hypothetical protein
MHATMDEWYARVASKLVAETPAGGQPHGDAALEVAFGEVRAAVAYVLELGRAHRINVAGHMTGDDVWMDLAGQRLRFTLNRREHHVLVRVGNDERRLVRWDEAQSTMVDSSGAPEHLASTARGAIDAMITAWSTSKDRYDGSSGREFEDEPTKG